VDSSSSAIEGEVLDGSLRDLSAKTLVVYLKNEHPDKHDEAKAKIASSVFATCSREAASQSARDALLWDIARNLLDKEHQAEYVRVSMPTSALAKALPPATGAE